MSSILVIVSIIIGKILIFLARLARRGGSSLPGRVALRLAPSVLHWLASRIEGGSVVVTATNGKTTTTRMLAGLVRHSGRAVITNSSGANMASGIVSAMIEAASLRGRFPEQALAIFELDEGSIPLVLPKLAPKIILIGNFFRDQLDRYGAVASLVQRIAETIAGLSRPPLLVINADDPLAASLGDASRSSVIWFGVDSNWESGLPTSAGLSEARQCPHCQGTLEYTRYLLCHLGTYHCPHCGRKRPTPDWAATKVRSSGMTGQEFCLEDRDGRSFTVTTGFPGLHAVYNALAALTALYALKLLDERAIDWLAQFRPPYGRYEEISLEGRTILLMLVKNSAGVNASLDVVARHAGELSVLLLLSDLVADGRDISWIYDASYEVLASAKSIVTGGPRAQAMALRMLHAGADPAHLQAVSGEVEAALDVALQKTAQGGVLALITTYSAMLAIRAVLVRRAGIQEFWKDGR